MLKWKPPSLNSVDFKLQIVREHKMGYVITFKGLKNIANEKEVNNRVIVETL